MLHCSFDAIVSIYHCRSSTSQSASGVHPVFIYTVGVSSGFAIYSAEIS